jgi:hypothetical protein
MSLFERVDHGTDTPAEIRRKRMANHMNYCVHYVGSRVLSDEGPCDVGLQRKGVIRCSACIGGHTMPDPKAECPQWERRSIESAEQRANQLERSLDRLFVIGPAVAEWRAKPPVGKEGDIDCPACGKGSLHLVQASNGHVSGRCSTGNCVHWME